MPYTTYNCDALQGGAARALDSYGVATLTTGDRAIVALSGTVYYFVYDSTATAAETVAAHPYVIRPDDYSAGGNWEEYTPELAGDTSPQLGGLLDTNAFAIDESYATVASHATTSAIWAALGNVINFTGTETITDFPAANRAGAQRFLICAAACVFTHAG
ncbi:MAG: hypothetical protein H8D56_06480, partial [Planctomycetes bacterium]|nr:hypothetical protein [Planctomycetota bacterium]